MRTSTLTRDFLQIFLVSSFILLISMLARSVSTGQQDECPRGTFGRNCRLTCQCKDDGDCDDVTGECPDGCLETWSGPNCQRQNVVLGMPTDMKTPDWSKGARAVDGDVKTCVTSSSNRIGWWRVDMKAPRTVFFMEIYFANQTTRQGRIRVHVNKYGDTFEGKPCARIPASHKRSKFTCDLPTAGRYFGIMNKGGQITLCEVNVYVCNNFTFGADCSQPCRCASLREVCHKVTGTCDSGCMAGWAGTSCNKPCRGRYGHRCRHACGHCHGNQSCDHVTGVCPQGCAPGWTGPLCKQACPEGKWGLNCSHSCQNCLDGATCRSSDGHCPWRCNPGWSGYRCDSECTPGFYGQSCEFSCGHCDRGSVCERKEGVCSMGCEPGYEGLFCTKACMQGTWGRNCRHRCGQCAANQTCDPLTGHCTACDRGWRGYTCNTTCKPGTYGVECASRCAQCRDKTKCDPFSGRCHGGCLAGWKGTHCAQVCGNETYGEGCAFKCGYCKNKAVCDHVSGKCPYACDNGYRGPNCNIRTVSLEDRLSRPDLGVLLIGCMVVVGCMLCGVATCLIVRSRRRSRTTTSVAASAHDSNHHCGHHDLMVPKITEDMFESPIRQTVV